MKQPKSSLQLPKSTRKTQKVAIASSKKKKKTCTINQKFTAISTPVKIPGKGTQKAFYQQYCDLVINEEKNFIYPFFL